jgi:hypothetical protein
MQRIIIDPESKSLAERYALVKAANRRRGRFPEGCVTVVESEEAARAGRDAQHNLHPALVYGPSSSSEGQKLYYLVKWL